MKTWDDIPQGEDRIQVYPTLAQAREQFGENYDGLVFRWTRASGSATAWASGSVRYSGQRVCGVSDCRGAPNLSGNQNIWLEMTLYSARAQTFILNWRALETRCQR